MIKFFNANVEGVTFPEGEFAIGAGETGPTAALVLLTARGHRNFKCPGVDGGAFEHYPDASSYAYPIARSEEEQALIGVSHVKVGQGGVMVVEDNLLRQAKQVGVLKEMFPDMEISFSAGTLNGLLYDDGYDVEVVADPKREFRQGFDR